LTANSVVFKDPGVSGKHCRIFKEDNNGGSPIVFIEDISTNGTYVDGEKIGKGNKLLLHNGAEISLLNTKNKNSEILAYIFQITSEESKEEKGGPQKMYDIRDTLGTGNFATVKLAIHKATGERFACKIIDKKKFSMQSSNRKDSLKDEVNILQAIKHPNIIAIKEIFESERTLYIILELVTGGELFDRIIDMGHFMEEHARRIFQQIVDAIDYIHDRGIAHRDLKPENILLKSKNEEIIKVTDFGLSRIISEGSFMKTMCGTPQYLAPEILTNAQQNGYGKEVDMWSLGVILYVLLCGYLPFREENGPIFQQVREGQYDFPEEEWSTISNAVKDLIRNLLIVDPSRRYTSKQTNEHPWMRGEDIKEEIISPSPKKEKVEKKIMHGDSDEIDETIAQNNHPTSQSSNQSQDEDSESKLPKRKRSQGQEECEENIPQMTPKKTRPLLPPCKYGSNCYRKNPQHFQEFSHPHLEQTEK